MTPGLTAEQLRRRAIGLAAQARIALRDAYALQQSARAYSDRADAFFALADATERVSQSPPAGPHAGSFPGGDGRRGFLTPAKKAL